MSCKSNWSYWCHVRVIRVTVIGFVYKGVLSDNRVAAIKRLHEANQGESER